MRFGGKLVFMVAGAGAPVLPGAGFGGGTAVFGGVLLVFGGVAGFTATDGAGAGAVVAAPLACGFFWKLSTNVSVPPKRIPPGSGRSVMLFTRMSEFWEARPKRKLTNSDSPVLAKVRFTACSSKKAFVRPPSPRPNAFFEE